MARLKILAADAPRRRSSRRSSAAPLAKSSTLLSPGRLPLRHSRKCTWPRRGRRGASSLSRCSTGVCASPQQVGSPLHSSPLQPPSGSPCLFVPQTFHQVETRLECTCDFCQADLTRVLPSGDLKYRHPPARAPGDVDCVSFAVQGMSALFPSMPLWWIADELAPNLPVELDFTAEAANADKCRDMFRGDARIVVPTVLHSLSSQRVLTMSFEQGVSVADPSGLSPPKSAHAHVGRDVAWRGHALRRIRVSFWSGISPADSS